MMIEAIKAFTDNYIWAVHCDDGLVIIDPGESEPVFEYLSEKDEEITAILLTHKHDDHIGGVSELKDRYPAAIIYGPEETAELNDQTVLPSEKYEIASQWFEVIACPGHTEGHIAFLADDELFCGDALFMAGCGRVFTGDYGAAYQGLQTLADLADKVRVYAGHEYTKTNLEFAQSVDFNPEKVSEVLAKVEELIELDQPSLPSTIGLEKEINPFLTAESLEEFINLRTLRDQF